MADITKNITFGRTPVGPFQWSGDVDSLLDLLASHLTAQADNLTLTGQVGGTEPTANIGMWLNNGVWYSWNDTIGKYLPIPLVIGRLFDSILRKTTLQSGAASADFTITFPNKSGTVALLDDLFPLYVPIWGLPPGVFGVINIDTRVVPKNHYIVLALNSVVSVAFMNVGERMDLWFEQPPSSSFTVTWQASLKFVGGSAPVMSTSGAGVRTIDHYIIWSTPGGYLVEKKQGFTITVASAQQDTTLPTFVWAVGVSPNTINVRFSEYIRGGSYATNNFIIKKNGVTQTVSSAVASTFWQADGRDILLTLTSNFAAGDVLTIQYVKTSAPLVTDIALNQAAGFGPFTVTNALGTEGNSANKFGDVEGGSDNTFNLGGQNLP